MFKSLFLQYLFGGLISLVTMTNPLSKIPLFISLTNAMSDVQREAQAKRASMYSGIIMLTSLIAGNIIFSVFGISNGALRIAGGLVVALLGYRMLFLSQDPGMAPKPANDREDYAFFPLAMPSLSGPGTIAVVIGLSTEIAELSSWAAKITAGTMSIIAILATSLCIWLVLHFASRLSSILGRAGLEVMTRISGFLLICVGVQFVVSGIRSFVV